MQSFRINDTGPCSNQSFIKLLYLRQIIYDSNTRIIYIQQKYGVVEKFYKNKGN